MSLPKFLGIGAERSGTSWLYEVLKSHPEIYLYPHLKEINYFSTKYHKGLGWYKRFFESSTTSNTDLIYGDISPTYFHYRKVPARVAKDLPNVKLILFLRNPIDRLYSEYKYNRLILNIPFSLDEYISRKPHSFNLGLYSQHLKRWLEYFSKEQFLILIFEEMMSDKFEALKRISKFLKIDYAAFDEANVSKKVHSSDIPQFHTLYTYAYKLSEKLNAFLVSNNLYHVSSKLKLGKKLFRSTNKSRKYDKLDLRTRRNLYLKYSSDINELENILKMNLSNWKLKN